jgi:membrane associated rhomboid family serine protease
MLPLGDANPPRRAPGRTPALILANAAVFAYAVQLAREGRIEAFVREYALVPWIVPAPAFVFLVLWFVMQASNGFDAGMSGVSGGVAWWAHAGGFVAGVGLLAVLRPRFRTRR